MKKLLVMVVLVSTIWIGISDEIGIASENEKVPEPISIIIVE